MHRSRLVSTIIWTLITVIAHPQLAPTSSSPVDPEHRELIEWAYGQFESHGLTLPIDLAIEFHESTDGCRGHQGLFIFDPAQVHICRTTDGSPDRDRLLRQVLLHELAHAWEREHLSSAERDVFIAHRGADSWNDSADEWYRRGAEHAAEIMTWGLLDQPIGFLNIHDKRCDQLQAAFELLTGQIPHAGLEHSCDAIA